MIALRLSIATFAMGLALPTFAQDRPPGGSVNANLGAVDYGVCRGTDPRCFHDWPRLKTTQFRVLLYTRTAGYRHAYLGPPLAAGMNPPLAADNVAQREMQRLAAANGIKLDYTEDMAQMTRLGGYNAVIFFSTSREVLNDDGKTALRQYIRAGGGFVGVHGAVGTLANWPYYEGLLGGTGFYDHAPDRAGDVVIVDRKDTSTKGLPSRFGFKDEWFTLVPFPSRVRFLATVDGKSLPPTTDQPDQFASLSGGAPPAAGLPMVVGRSPGHGDFHPVAWCHYYDGGRVWVTTLGHNDGIFATDDAAFPGAKAFQSLILAGIKSAAGMEPFCR